MSYYNVDEVATATTNLAATYGALATLLTLPNKTTEGRSSEALHLSSAPGAARDAVMIIAGVHGAEWGSCEIALNLATDLLKAYCTTTGLTYLGKAFNPQEIQNLLDLHDIIIFPLVNPDGRHCSQTAVGREQWRKNLNPAHSRGDPEAVGVDINRNFDFLFNLKAFAVNAGVSASADPAKPDYYQGPAAFSEPETQNVRWLLDQFPSTRWFIDLHCTGQTIHYVWSDDNSQQADPAMNFLNPIFDGKRGLPGQGYGEFLAQTDLASMQALAQCFADDLQAVQGTAYAVGPAYEISPFSGTSHDYAYSRHLSDPSKGHVLAFVVEWGLLDSQPLWKDMETIVIEVTAGLIGFCAAAQ